MENKAVKMVCFRLMLPAGFPVDHQKEIADLAPGVVLDTRSDTEENRIVPSERSEAMDVRTYQVIVLLTPLYAE